MDPSQDGPNILMVEDDAGVAQIVSDGLSAHGCVVEHAPSLSAGRAKMVDGRFDAIILDLILPDGDGLEFASALRTAGNDVPILMLTAKESVNERVEGFRNGADDYMCKPFEIAELHARLQAILRRSRAAARSVLAYADVELELITRKVRRLDIEAVLSPREAELLAYLMHHPEEILPREQILEQVWGDEAEDDSNVLNVYVNYLRNKIEAGRYSRLIQTVHGRGYMLSDRDANEHDS
jgi:two-component system response regulator MprA